MWLIVSLSGLMTWKWSRPYRCRKRVPVASDERRKMIHVDQLDLARVQVVFLRLGEAGERLFSLALGDVNCTSSLEIAEEDDVSVALGHGELIDRDLAYGRRSSSLR